MAINKCSREVETGTTRSLEPGISGSQGKRPNHWALATLIFSSSNGIAFLYIFCGLFIDSQIKYSPRRVPGFGMTDGEVLERLWSFLRRFGKMTKEMRPNHRIDVLSDALLFYAKKKSASLGEQ